VGAACGRLEFFLKGVFGGNGSGGGGGVGDVGVFGLFIFWLIKKYEFIYFGIDIILK
jgi:hypothetical protein